MPNQRAENQTLIAFALNRKLLAALDRACDLTGEDRSTFIRQALVNSIRAHKGKVEDAWVHAQVRSRGKYRYVAAPPAATPAPAAANGQPKAPAAPPAKKRPGRPRKK